MSIWFQKLIEKHMGKKDKEVIVSLAEARNFHVERHNHKKTITNIMTSNPENKENKKWHYGEKPTH